MKKLSLLALIFSFTAGIALAESKRQSTDKVEYPEAVAMKLNIELPIIGKSLGGTPEDLAGGNEVLNRSESHNRISDMLRQVNIYDVGRSVQLQHSSLFRSDDMQPDLKLWLKRNQIRHPKDARIDTGSGLILGRLLVRAQSISGRISQPSSTSFAALGQGIG